MHGNSWDAGSDDAPVKTAAKVTWLDRGAMPSGFVQVSNINRFFCLQELGRENEAVRREILALDVGDTPLYEIGKYALIRDYAGLIKRIRHTTQGSEASIDKKHLKELPLVKRAMRESRPVRSLLASNSPNQAVTTRSNRMKRHR